MPAKLITLACYTCGGPFNIYPSRKTPTYCSVACAHADPQRKKRPIITIDQVCPTCGDTFQSRKGVRRKFCSKGCLPKPMVRETFACKECGKAKPLRPLDPNVFCSIRCRAKHHRKWQRPACSHCGRTYRLTEKLAAKGLGPFCSTSCQIEHGEGSDFKRNEKPYSPEFKSRLLSNRELDPETGCWLWTSQKDKNGYGILSISKIRWKVHRVSSHVFNGTELYSSKMICHHCDRPGCFNPDHLFEGTGRDNIRDARSKGRLADRAGTKHGMSKLTEAQVAEMRELRKDGASTDELAARFSVHAGTVLLALRRDTWKHVP